MNIKKKLVSACVCMALSIMALMPLHAETTKLGLTLSGGLTYVVGGDPNTYVDSLNQSFTLLAQQIEVEKNGAFQKLHMGFDLAGALTIDFNKSFGFSLGSGWIQAAKGADTNVISFLYAGQNVGSTALAMTFRAIPVSFNAIFRHPLSSTVAITFSGGASYYFAQLNYSMTINNLIEGNTNVEVKANGHGIGLQTAAGVEFALGKNIFLLANIEGRYARIGSIKGDTIQDGNIIFKDFACYYYEQDGLGVIDFSKEQPHDAAYKNIREAKVDLSGIAARIGIKVIL